MRHSSAPESKSPPTVRPQARETGNRLFVRREGEGISVRLTRTPPSSEPGRLGGPDRNG